MNDLLEDATPHVTNTVVGCDNLVGGSNSGELNALPPDHCDSMMDSSIVPGDKLPSSIDVVEKEGREYSGQRRKRKRQQHKQYQTFKKKRFNGRVDGALLCLPLYNTKRLQHLSYLDAAKELAKCMHESKYNLLKNTICQVGLERTIQMFHETCQIQEAGGIVSSKGTKKAPGGVFFTLLKKSASPGQLKDIFMLEKKKIRERKNVQKRMNTSAVKKEKFEKTSLRHASSPEQLEEGELMDIDGCSDTDKLKVDEAVREFEATSNLDYVPVQEFEATSNLDYVPVQKFEATSNLDYVPVQEFEATSNLDYVPVQAASNLDYVPVQEFEATSNLDYVPVQEFEAASNLDYVPVQEFEAASNRDYVPVQDAIL